MKKKYKIAHYISSCGIASRRKAEQIVLEGRIKLNNQIINNLACIVDKTDNITLDDKPIKIIEKPRLYGYYKPIKTLVTHQTNMLENDNKINIFELIAHKHKQLNNLLSVGRLDYMTEGLILLTDSNLLCSELMHSKTCKRGYKILLDKIPSEEMINWITKDFNIDSVRYKAWKIKNIHNQWITVELTEGKNREIRKTFEYLGINIKRLIRLYYGKYHLKGSPGDLWELNYS